MKINLTACDLNQTGLEMYDLISELYPICRSITGNGVRETLKILQRHIPLDIREVPTGMPVFDWTVPKEWNVRDAYVKNAKGEKVIDFKKSNLHLLNYSTPIHEKIPLAQLKEHLFTLSDRPDWIPYRTSYYSENWGFCLTHRQFEALEDGEYEVYIDSSLEDGYLTYGEYFLKGETSDEILLSCHICHPSLCNDNLSGISLVAFLAKHLSTLSLRYSYRFLFIPGTIGSITWLSLNEDKAFQIKHGLVAAGVGDSGNLTYKKSRCGDAQIDRTVAHILQHSTLPYAIAEFSPYGYDERQFCSPGFNLPVGSLTRTPFNCYPEYHTSADNLDFVRPNALAESLDTYLAILEVLESNKKYVNTNPKCEPQLGKRGLYGSFGGKKSTKAQEMAMLWVLNLSDGDHSLLDIAERSQLEFSLIREAAEALLKNGLLRETYCLPNLKEVAIL
jgi:aminopeptidase-like protein